MRLLVVFVMGIHLSIANATDIYRWVDDQGRIHIADSIPEHYRSNATRIDSKQFELSESERSAALASLPQSALSGPRPLAFRRLLSGPLHQGCLQALLPQQRHHPPMNLEVNATAYGRHTLIVKNASHRITVGIGVRRPRRISAVIPSRIPRSAAVLRNRAASSSTRTSLSVNRGC